MLLAERVLYLLFTPRLCRGEPFASLGAALAAGVDLVQWRVQTPDPAGLRRCQELCAATGVPLIVNDDVDLAVRIGAAGAHVGQDDLPAREARARLGDRLLGVSTHDDDQIARALADGADHLGFGPCFPTLTKGYAQGQPPAAVRSALDAAGDTPVYAIGGITAANLDELLELGVDRIAVSSAILAAPDPAAATRELRQRLSP
ncbi:MAG: thiamine phosphate synthase [bacterium]|nr:thiamine phosphate synthase [bacterium]